MDCKPTIKILLAVLFALVWGQVGAVLPERSVDKTVMLLNDELSDIKANLDNEREYSDAGRQKFWARIAELEEQIAIARFALLSHGVDNPLGMAKATQNAQELIDRIDRFQKPVDGLVEGLSDKIARTEGICRQLAAIDTTRLTADGLADRHEAMALCDSITTYYADYMQRISADRTRYQAFESHVATLVVNRWILGGDFI